MKKKMPVYQETRPENAPTGFLEIFRPAATGYWRPFEQSPEYLRPCVHYIGDILEVQRKVETCWPGISGYQVLKQRIYVHYN
jgi:hypothetical protein